MHATRCDRRVRVKAGTRIPKKKKPRCSLTIKRKLQLHAPPHVNVAQI